MPRGPLKRRQLNRNRSLPRVPNKTATNSPARADLERRLATKPIGQRPNDSDDSDRLVVKGHGRRASVRQEIYATGAVGHGDKPGAYPTRAQRRRSLSKDTNDMLARAKTNTERDGKSTADDREHKLPLKSITTNGASAPVGSAKMADKGPSTLFSSATKAPASVLRPSQPTPSRETSILGTLKPRRRQPSILQNLDANSSTLDLDDEEEFLPDAESTPLNLIQARTALSTPATTSIPSSSSRKRKLDESGIPQPPRESSSRQLATSPLTTMQLSNPTPEPSLPTIPISKLRGSGRKLRESLDDEGDIMAPPESSSSPIASPAKSKTRNVAPRSSRQKPVPMMTTEELQSTMMPTKRRRTARQRTKTPGTEFDIPADSSSPEQAPEDDSSFLPARKAKISTRRRELPRGTKPRQGKSKSAKTKKPAKEIALATTHSRSSTRSFITTATTTSAPILSHSTSQGNRKAKSPSQPSSTAANTSHSTRASTKTANPVSVSASPVPPGQRSGGSLISHPGADLAEKENAPGDMYLARQGRIPSDLDMSEEETGSATYRAKRVEDPKKLGSGRSKWADIDAWDMDFEEVEVMTPSGSGGSSPMRR